MYFHFFSIEFSHVFLILFPFLSNIAVAGDGDGIVSASDMEALAQALPKSTSATVANAGHVPMLEARPKLDSIRRWPCYCLILPTGEPPRLCFLFVFVWLGDLQKLRQFGSLHGWYSVYSIVTNSIYVFIHVHTVHNFLERPWIHSKNPLGTLWDWNKIERYRGAWQSGSSLAQVDSVNSGKSQEMWRATFGWDVCVVWMTG